MTQKLRKALVELALEWQGRYGVAPSITAAVSEFDAAMLVGCSEEELTICTATQTAVQRGHDFIHEGLKYQVKANRPSGRRGSTVTLVSKPKNYDWDRLIWIHYRTDFSIQEAWSWEVGPFKDAFMHVPRLRPSDLQKGVPLVKQGLYLTTACG